MGLCPSRCVPANCTRSLHNITMGPEAPGSIIKLQPIGSRPRPISLRSRYTQAICPQPRVPALQVADSNGSRQLTTRATTFFAGHVEANWHLQGVRALVVCIHTYVQTRVGVNMFTCQTLNLTSEHIVTTHRNHLWHRGVPAGTGIPAQQRLMCNSEYFRTIQCY